MIKLRHAISYTKSITRLCSTVSQVDNLPLNGIRILDLTRIVAGPYCTMILGDLGADVIKVEKPGSGDEARKWGPPFINNTSETPYFVAVNRNKRSICIDLKSAEGRDLIYALAGKCDVFIENYVPGKLDQLKLGYSHVKSVSPNIIYCSITGYGSEGPYSKRPGYDVIAASMGGLLHITGPRGGEPIKVGVAATDMATGLYAHGAILAALFHRSRTGHGQKIECNLLSTQVASLINMGSNYLNSGLEGQRWGTAHESIVPYEAFPSKDGYFTIGTGSDKQFIDLCNRLGRPDIAHNSKYANNPLRVENRTELIDTLKSIIVNKTNGELKKIFENAPFPCGPINSLKDVFEDEHIMDIKLVKEIRHPTAGTVKVVGPPVKYSKSDNNVRLPPPLLGEHTKDILRHILQFDEDQINKLHENKVIQ